MRVVIQRVTEAHVTIDQQRVAEIQAGLLVLVGIEEIDFLEDVKWLSSKILNLRIFNDEAGVMNKSVLDVEGELLVVSQFTLHAATKKGNRPSYIKAARPDVAIPLYEAFVNELQDNLGRTVQTGRFGADMKVNLCNDGPVTILIDSQNKE